MSEFRIGYVSSIDYENALCEVHYPDRDDTCLLYTSDAADD